MASKTLTAIMKHWTAEFPPNESPVTFPFDIEEFCRENDQPLREAHEAGRASENEACAKLVTKEFCDWDDSTYHAAKSVASKMRARVPNATTASDTLTKKGTKDGR